jgi:hypothetical protein
MTPEQYSAAAVPRMKKTTLYGVMDSIGTNHYLKALMVLRREPLVEIVAARSLDEIFRSTQYQRDP